MPLFHKKMRLIDLIEKMGQDARFVLIDSKGHEIGVVSVSNRGTWWAWYDSKVQEWYFDDKCRLCVKVDSNKKFVEDGK